MATTTAAPPLGNSTDNSLTNPVSYMELKHRLHRKLLERINLDRLAAIDAPRMRREVRAALEALVAEESHGLDNDGRVALVEEVLNEVFGLGPLDPLMQDPSVSDVLVTTHNLFSN